MKRMYPDRETAEALLAEAERCNPGPWGDHSRIAAHCAQRIAEACPDMDSEKAYILAAENLLAVDSCCSGHAVAKRHHAAVYDDGRDIACHEIIVCKSRNHI